MISSAGKTPFCFNFFGDIGYCLLDDHAAIGFVGCFRSCLFSWPFSPTPTSVLALRSLLFLSFLQTKKQQLSDGHGFPRWNMLITTNVLVVSVNNNPNGDLNAVDLQQFIYGGAKPPYRAHIFSSVCAPIPGMIEKPSVIETTVQHVCTSFGRCW